MRGFTCGGLYDPAIDPETPNELPISSGPSALPSRTARFLAFGAILVAGVCGGLIGYAVVEVQCKKGNCATAEGVAALIGAVLAAGGVAIVAVLVLRAMGEWAKIVEERDALDEVEARDGEDDVDRH